MNRRLLLPALLFFTLASLTALGESLPNFAHGPFGVIVDDSVELDVRTEKPPMALRVVYPDAEGPWPLVVFSHGTFSSNKMYMPVVEHWASHGYVIILPNHIDADYGAPVRSFEDMQAIIESRMVDMSLILNELDQIQQRIPALKDMIRKDHFVAAGHSVGTYVAMYVAGLKVRNPETDVVTSHVEDRYDAVLMLSDPGKMALQPDDLWTGVTVPTFLSTGSADYGTMGKGNRPTEYVNERLSGEGSPAGTKYLLLIDEGDHYFGGLIHREVDAEPDAEGLAIFNSLSTTFLEAYANEDPTALEYLRGADIDAATKGRASLEVK